MKGLIVTKIIIAVPIVIGIVVIKAGRNGERTRVPGTTRAEGATLYQGASSGIRSAPAAGARA